MSKTRVYELAQQMGIDNKELMARLAEAGVQVKNHMAVLEDSDIKAVSAPAQTPHKEVSQEEVRVKPTLIRRRAKAVEPEAPPAAETATTETPAAAPATTPVAEAAPPVAAGADDSVPL